MMDPNSMGFDENVLSSVNTIADLAELTIADKRGNPAIQFGFVVKLYFKAAYANEVRLRLIRLVEDYAAIFADHITHYMPYEGNRLKSIRDFDYVAYAIDHMRKIPPEDRVDGFDAELYGFKDAVDRDEPTPYHVGIVAGPAINKRRLGNTENALGRLEAYFPADWPKGDYSKLLAVFRRWADIAQPSHGTLGLGLIIEEGGSRGPLSDVAFPFLKRFAGLEYPDLSLWMTMSEDAETPVIRSTNWLTLIDNKRAEHLGGVDRIEEALDPSCPVHRYREGLIIQAGPEPRLGARNRNDQSLDDYRKVAAVLKPLRFENFGRWGIFDGLQPPLDDRAETLAWVRRFD